MVYGCFASHGFIGSSSFRLIDDQRKKVMVEYGVELRNLKFLFFFFSFFVLWLGNWVATHLLMSHFAVCGEAVEGHLVK